jgi:hypothetical protein
MNHGLWSKFTMKHQLSKKLTGLGLIAVSLLIAGHVSAQNEEAAGAVDDSTITYPAAFFAEYSPVSVNDMINVIPGVNLSGGGRRGGNRRGLGSGENEILINGQRMTGKSNSGRDQLSRISASQVDYIEIIRGSSEELDVRNSGQTLNVVLLDSGSRRSINTEVNMDRYEDGTLDPGGKVSMSGQTGSFSYLLSAEAEPRYNNNIRNESSYDPDYTLKETIYEESVREETDLAVSSAFSYQFSKDLFQINALYGERSPPTDTERFITDQSLALPETRLEREESQFDRYNWEIGGDWEHSFDDGSKYRVLFIVNDQEGQNVRERFKVADDGTKNKDLFLYNLGRDRERIIRTSYTFNLAEAHGVEVGVERAQTIRNSDLRIGIPSTSGTPSDSVGGLVPLVIPNSTSEVEEIRYESFAVHNWQINDRMSLESTLLFEQSEISQSGDVSLSRDFNFVRPKIDYRFDLTSSMQFRASIERDISQLSFSDFSASTDNSDDDKDTELGNPNIVQEQSWVYTLNLEYRLPNNVGVLNSSVFYREIEDVIDRVDISTGPDNLSSTRGNIGDGERWGLNLSASLRLGFLGLPSALLNTNLSLQDSEIVDPFLGTTRRMRNNSRGFAGMGYRHDLTQYNMNYGFNYSYGLNGGTGRTSIDVDDIETYRNEPNLTLFMEKQAFGGTTFRLEAQNSLDSISCRERIRFDGATKNGVIEEIENSCNGSGPKFAVKVRRTF